MMASMLEMPTAQDTHNPVAKPTPKSFEVIYLEPEQIRFERRDDTLSLTLSGDQDAVQQHFPRVVLRSCFPVSQDKFYLSVRDTADEDGPQEIGIIRDWTQLADADRQAVSNELGLHYFVPRIHKVYEVKDEFGFLYWTVDTDKGHKEFVMRNNVIREAREIAPGHWLLIDVNQARYEIENVSALDRPSQKLINRFLYL
ncbi:MAG: DUF1854 domain-containing protein [Anaerolineae bacterium]|nr:DUF1854 domain-containing protein [Anaerolineae bacterium]